MYSHRRGRNNWQIFFKFNTNIPFCNSVDKFVGQNNTLIFMEGPKILVLNEIDVYARNIDKLYEAMSLNGSFAG